MELHEPLLAWFEAHKRDLPWRRTSDAYAIWVSEIMLQQTQVATVLPYYHRWMERFPTVQALAAADEQEVLAVWQGLGYYRRCRMLLEGARLVAGRGLPSAASSWRKIPGVGAYTAGALASIAFGEATPVVDGNVQRVMARLTGCSETGRSLEKRVWSWAAESMFRERPGDWNQALMELGATVCTPKKPACPLCPLTRFCRAHSDGTVDELPKAAPQPKTVALRHRVWVPHCDGRVGVRQIPPGQWWSGMWEFPRGAEELDLYPSAVRIGEFKHSVTNHRITVEVFLAQLAQTSPELEWHTAEGLAQIAMPAPQRRALKLALARIEPSGTAR